MKAWIGAVALAGSLASTGAAADGNILLSQCRAALQEVEDKPPGRWSYNTGVCIGHITAMTDMLNGWGTSLPQNLRVCMPDPKITYGQGARIVVKFLEAHPEHLHKSETAMTLVAFRFAYPCET